MTFAAVGASVAAGVGSAAAAAGTAASAIGAGLAAAAPAMATVGTVASLGNMAYQLANSPSGGGGGYAGVGGGGWGAPAGPQGPYSQQQQAMQAQLAQQSAFKLPGSGTGANSFGGDEFGLNSMNATNAQGKPTFFAAEGGEVDTDNVDLRDSDYIIPADVVSALGNGSTEAGARALEDFMRKVQEMSGALRQHAQGIAGAGVQRIG